MVFEDFIVDLFNSVKKPDGALTCFVYVDGEELLNTTCLFKDVLLDAEACADRLSLAVDPVVGQAVRENKSVALMAVVSIDDNDEVYRFKYFDGELVSNQSLNESKIYNEFVSQAGYIPTFDEMVTTSKEQLELMRHNGVEETKERYDKRVSIMKKVFGDKDIEINELFDLYDKYTETFF